MSPKHSLENIESAVKHFLETETKRAIKSRTTDLVVAGIISSFTMFHLIEFIEKKFKIEVDIMRLKPENFNSLQNITHAVSLWISK